MSKDEQEKMTNINKQQFINIVAIIPSLVISIAYFMLEIATSILILLVASKHAMHFSFKSAILVFVIVTIFFETLHRAGNVNYHIIRFLLTIRGRVERKIRNFIRSKGFIYRAITVIYTIGTFIFLWWGCQLFIDGIRLRGSMPPTNVITNGITIISGALAIFFAIAAVVVQNLLEKYSSVFLRKVIGNVVFILSFLFMIFFIIGGLFLLRYGSNEHFETLSFVATIYAVINLGLMIWLLIYFLDVTNVVFFIARNSCIHLKRIPKVRHVKLSYEIGNDDKGDNKAIHLYKVKTFLNTWIRGVYSPFDFSGILPPLDVPKDIVDSLKNDLRPIMSACLKAIGEDNRDVVLSCLNEITQICSAYLNRRKNYRGMDDSFLMFIYSQLEIIFNNAIKVPNQQYTADIVATVNIIALKCTGLTETQLRPGENGLVHSWISFLKGAVIKTIHLEHTSAPTDAIQSISNIAVVLIENEAFTTSIYGAAEDLKMIGIISGKLGGSWASLLCQRSINGLVVMLFSLFKVLRDKGWVGDHNVSKLCENIEKVMDMVYDTKMDFMTYSTISAPLVGSLWSDGNFADIFRTVLSQKYDKRHSEGHALRELENLAKTLRYIGAKAITNGKGHTSEYFMSFSEIAYSSIHYLLNLNKEVTSEDEERESLSDAGSDLLKEVVTESLNMFSWYPSSEGHGYDFLNKLSPIGAFLTYYARSDQPSIFYEIRNKFIEKLLEIYVSFKPKGGNQINRKWEIYRYLKLFGAWIYKYSREDSLTLKLIRLLAESYPGTLTRDPFYYSNSKMERLGYPSEHIGQQWYVYPSDFWPNEQWVVTNELNDMRNYEKYDKVISRFHRRIKKGMEGDNS